MKEELINKIRQLQLLISVFVFIIVAFQCWIVSGLNITEIQVSAWGVTKDIGWMWNGSVVLVSLAILFNVIWWINKHKRLQYKGTFYILFTFMSFCLILVGLFPSGSHRILHEIPAFIYFFSYPMIIFAMAFINRKEIQYNEWIKHLSFSLLMIMIPLAFISAFKGMAISEMLHTIIVAIWNLTLLDIKHGIKREN